MYQLEQFTSKDIPKLLSWIPSEKEYLIWSGSGYKWPIDKNQLEQTLDKARNSKLKYFLFKFIAGNSFVGYIELRKLESDEKISRIGRLIIDPNQRGRGLGKELINAIKEYAKRKLNIHILTLGVFSFNHSAISLYEKTGFIITDYRNKSGYFNNEKWELLLMECHLY